ncbi:hypothetical protein J2S43_007060 [Catenuloplanes nepalensis]|uniref:Putative Flp pilus-assembly TadG-like N-terminal domain-containing protein n=1 Tax=Catenuloplanes nepalensis TaxID=587533 RepID=A0ABT9N4B9_9ACTN|nr:pilus assembly protein TadG-related protein [Catenuloplanes nepalensis]MDP9798548.1 hypothetical protein [Catenuloplanes nepalensis]
MPRLTGRRSRRRDRGAIAVLVATLFASGTVAALGAMTVDVGLIYAERAQLQSAADAAAIAVANVCALRLPECNPTDIEFEGLRYARENVKNEAVEVSAVCGSVNLGVPLSIQPCPVPPPSNLTGCLGSASGTDEYLEVRVQTLRSGGSTALPPAFAGAVTGTDGVTVGACARASWQVSSTVPGALPVVMSDCRVQQALDTYGPQRAPERGRHRARRAAEVRLPFRETDAGSPMFGHCRRSGSPRPSDATDGFGGDVLGDDPTRCARTTFTTGEVRELRDGDGDANAFWGEGRRGPKPPGCFALLNELMKARTPVPVAVYRPVPSGGARIDSVRSFVITGWYRAGWPDREPPRPRPDDRWNKASTLTGQSRCPTFAASCLFGYFTDDPAGGGAAGPSSIRITG